MGTPVADPDGLPFKPIDARTLGDQATERLRLAIQTGLFAPGRQLVERELAAQLGMSRVPVREAIQRLAEEGLVTKTANRGAMVYLPSPDEIEEITSIRIVLEQFVTERVLQRWTPAIDAEFCDIVEQMRSDVRARDRPRLAQLDTHFHTTTWQVAEHAVLMEVVSSLRQRVTRLLYETIALMSDEDLPGVVESHERLIAVLRTGDIGQARDEMSMHITKGKDRILAVYKRRLEQ